MNADEALKNSNVQLELIRVPILASWLRLSDHPSPRSVDGLVSTIFDSTRTPVVIPHIIDDIKARNRVQALFIPRIRFDKMRA
jgi:hypothetical protein